MSIPLGSYLKVQFGVKKLQRQEGTYYFNKTCSEDLLKKQCYFYFALHVEHMGLYKINVYEDNHMEQLKHEYLKDCSQAPTRLWNRDIP